MTLNRVPGTGSKTRSRWSTPAVLFSLSLTAKLVAIALTAVVWGRVPLAEDTSSVYRPLALALLGGDGYVLAGDVRDASRIPPLTPLLLAGVYALFGPGVSATGLAVTGALLRALTTVLVYGLGVRLLGPSVAVVAALLHALDPWEATWVWLLKDSLAVFLFMAAAVEIQAALDRPDWRRSLGGGALLGLATLSRYVAMGFAIPVLVVIGLRARAGRLTVREGGRLTLGLLAGLALTLAPWLVRNRIVLGETALSTHFAGRHFYVGNGPGAERSGSGYAGDALPPSGLIREVERSAHSVRESEWRLLRGGLVPLWEQPSRVLVLARSKLVNMWRPTYRDASRRGWVLLGLPYLLVMALALVGLGLAVRRRLDLAIPYAAVSYYLAASLVFYAEIRQRQFLTPFLVLFAGMAVVTAWRAAVSKHSRP